MPMSNAEIIAEYRTPQNSDPLVAHQLLGANPSAVSRLPRTGHLLTGRGTEYFREQADWRRQKAADYPNDRRNLRAAHGLGELATHVLSLPAGDERIQELASLAVRDGVFSPYEEGSHEISRFRFHDQWESCDAFLSRLVGIMTRDQMQLAEDGGVFFDDATQGA